MTETLIFAGAVINLVVVIVFLIMAENVKKILKSCTEIATELKTPKS